MGVIIARAAAGRAEQPSGATGQANAGASLGPAFETRTQYNNAMGASPSTPSNSPTIREPRSEVESDRASAKTLIAAALLMFFAALITLPVGWLVFARIRDSGEATAPGNVAADTESESAPVNDPRRDLEQLPDIADESREITSLRKANESLLGNAGLPAEQVRQWDLAVEAVRANWTRMNLADNSVAASLIRQVFYDKATTPAYANTLAEGIKGARDVARPAAEAAEALCAEIWVDGVLEWLIHAPGMPDTAVRAIGRGGAESRETSVAAAAEDFAIQMRAACERRARGLAEQMEHGDADLVSAWRGWLRATSALSAGERKTELIAGALLSLTREIRTADSDQVASVVALLLAATDPSRSETLRTAVVSSLADPLASGRVLAAITSYLAASGKIAGADARCIVTESMSTQERAETAQQLAQVWARVDPQANGNSSRGNLAPAVQEWIGRAENMLARPDGLQLDVSQGDDDTQAVRQLESLIEWALLNRAAWHLEHGEHDAARKAMDDGNRLILLARGGVAPGDGPRVQNSTHSGPGLASNGSRPGSWGAEVLHLLAINDIGGAEESLNRLISGAQGHSGDLDEVDAAVLARLAVSGAPREVRLLAQQCIRVTFTDGPNVLLALADALPTERAEVRLSESIEQITSIGLPAPDESGWYAQARGQLVSRVLNLRGGNIGSDALDALARLLARVYSVREAIESESDAPQDPAIAAQELAAEWKRMAGATTSRAVIPYPLAEIEARSRARQAFAESAIDAFAAAQLDVLEFAGLLTGAQRPAAQDVISRTIEAVCRRRFDAGHAATQMIAVERGMTRLWMIRLSQGRVLPDSGETHEIEAGADAPVRTVRGLGDPSETMTQSRLELERALEALKPEDARGYFLTGETALDLGEREIGMHALVVAAALSPTDFEAGAALALAQAAREMGDEAEARRLTAVAYLSAARYGRPGAIRMAGRMSTGRAERASAAAGIAGFRRGDGAKAARFLQSALDQSILPRGLTLGSETIESAIAKSRSRLRCEACKNTLYVKCPTCKGREGTDCDTCKGKRMIVCTTCDGHPGPVLPRREEDRLLRIEAALLSGTASSWSGQFTIDRNRPLAVMEPELLARSLRIDTTQTLYRDGTWTRP